MIIYKGSKLLGQLNKKRDHQRWSLFLFSSLVCLKPVTSMITDSSNEVGTDGKNAVPLAEFGRSRPKAILLNLARSRDKFVNTGCRK